jgi:cysteine-rich repeat protein
VCGDGVAEGPVEECDDGGLVDGDGCSSVCTVEAPASARQQKCINELNKRGAKLAKLQNKQDLSCLKSAGKGRTDKLGTPATAQDCLTNDPRGKLARAAAKTTSGETKKCDPADLPTFAYTDAATVNSAAMGEVVALVADLYGPDLDLAVIDKGADKIGARCQLELSKRSGKLLDTLFKLTTKEKKKLLAGKPDGTTALSNAVLAAQLQDFVETDGSGKIAANEGKVVSKVAARCGGVDLVAAFPGCAVASVGPLADCAKRAARCRFCRAFNAMDGLAIDCDELDDGQANLSCP